jgi:hypothetical protein
VGESQHFDRSALQAFLAAAWEEFHGEVLLLVRDGSRIKLGPSESGGLNARVIGSECLSRLNQLEEHTLDTTARAFVRLLTAALIGGEQNGIVVRDYMGYSGDRVSQKPGRAPSGER